MHREWVAVRKGTFKRLEWKHNQLWEIENPATAHSTTLPAFQPQYEGQEAEPGQSSPTPMSATAVTVEKYKEDRSMLKALGVFAAVVLLVVAVAFAASGNSRPLAPAAPADVSAQIAAIKTDVESSKTVTKNQLDALDKRFDDMNAQQRKDFADLQALIKSATASQAPGGDDVGGSPSPSASSSPVPSMANCPPSHRLERVPVKDVAWKPTEPGWIVLRAWSNQTDPNWPVTQEGNEVVVLYGPDIDARPMAFVGGSYWPFDSEQCGRDDFAGQIAFVPGQPMAVDGEKIDLTNGGSFPSDLLPTQGTPAPTVAVTPQPAVAEKCHVIKDYRLMDHWDIDSVGSFIQVEFWWKGQPERETLLQGGQVKVDNRLDGHVWEYHPVCTEQDVMAQIKAQIKRRLADSANNAGYVASSFNSLFEQISVNPPYTGGFPSSTPEGCHVIHDYLFGPYSDGLSLPEVATSGNWIHVEYWRNGEPESETILPGGRYNVLDRSVGGWVFEYPPSCTLDDVTKQVQEHIQRRLSEGANNSGQIVTWESLGLFELVPGSSDDN